jgi:tRNA 2-thiouridine synthesizing protein E
MDNKTGHTEPTHHTAYEEDKDGFLRHPEDWTPALAEHKAEMLNLTLTEDHWALIDLVRNFYLENQLHLTNRALIKQIRKTLTDDKANSLYVLSLFPEAPARTLALLAGLPKPPFCF